MIERPLLLASTRYRLGAAQRQLEESQAYLAWQRSPEGQACEDQWLHNLRDSELDIQMHAGEVAYFDSVLAALEGKT